MPIYQYRCQQHGEFDDIRPVELRQTTECRTEGCGETCPQIIAVNPDMAKTGYTLPPKAKRKYGDEHVTSHTRKRWF